MNPKTLALTLTFLTTLPAFADGLIGSKNMSSADYISSTAPLYNTDIMYFSSVWFLGGFTKPEISQLVNSTVQSLRFNALSGDGADIGTEMTLQNPAFSNLFVDGLDNVRIRQTWKLSNCDGVSINPDDGIDPASLSIESVVTGLCKTDFSRYMNCTFFSTSEACSEVSDGFNCEGASRMILKDTGSIEFPSNFGNGHTSQAIFTPTHPVDMAQQSAVQDATEDFVSTVKDYGNTLVALRGATNANRHAALSGWIAKNGPTLVKDLNEIEQHLGSASTITKLSVTTSVNQAYAYVHYLEGQVQGEFMLDQVVKTN